MLHSAVVEVRQHLCCANVFLKFKNSLTDSESLKIIVDESNVKLQNTTCKAEISVNGYFAIIARTFSNLVVDAKNASFRISVQDVQIVEDDEYNKKEAHVQISLADKDDTSVMCSNCYSTVAKQQKYDKIREFPSGAIDVNEFFCHHGPNYENILVPSTSDIFYGFLFIIVNRDIIEKSTREKEDHIYCGRCLRYLGETMFNGKAAKLWCESIRFDLKGQIVDVFASDDKSHIYKLIVKAIEESSLPLAEPLLRNMHFTKVLFTSSLPNRQQQYLLVHILEKHLPVLRNNTSLAEGYCQNTYELKQNKAFKILYRLIAKDDENNDETKTWPAILDYWQQNINILKMKISPLLFSDLSKELNENMKILPEIYRVNNDDFLLSYIFY